MMKFDENLILVPPFSIINNEHIFNSLLNNKAKNIIKKKSFDDVILRSTKNGDLYDQFYMGNEYIYTLFCQYLNIKFSYKLEDAKRINEQWEKLAIIFNCLVDNNIVAGIYKVGCIDASIFDPDNNVYIDENGIAQYAPKEGQYMYDLKRLYNIRDYKHIFSKSSNLIFTKIFFIYFFPSVEYEIQYENSKEYATQPFHLWFSNKINVKLSDKINIKLSYEGEQIEDILSFDDVLKGAL